jgi:hypothetical protein
MYELEAVLCSRNTREYTCAACKFRPQMHTDVHMHNTHTHATSAHRLHLHSVSDALRERRGRAIVAGINFIRVVATVACDHVRQRGLAEA